MQSSSSFSSNEDRMQVSPLPGPDEGTLQTPPSHDPTHTLPSDESTHTLPSDGSTLTLPSHSSVSTIPEGLILTTSSSNEQSLLNNGLDDGKYRCPPNLPAQR